MSEDAHLLKTGPFRNDNGNISIKKTLGTIGVLMFFGMCVFAIIKDPSTATILGVLERLGWFSGALLGLKIVSGAASTLANKER